MPLEEPGGRPSGAHRDSPADAHRAVGRAAGGATRERYTAAYAACVSAVVGIEPLGAARYRWCQVYLSL
jgi:hypothetical protein